MARLDELERKFEENPRRYFAPLANEYRKAGDAQRAAELCRAQLPDIPGHISGHIVLGQALYDAGDFPGSRAALETALALDPENIVAMRYLGDIARETGESDEARRWFARTLEADPYNEAATSALQSLRDSDGSASATAGEPARDETVTFDRTPVDGSGESDAFAGDLEISAVPESTEAPAQEPEAPQLAVPGPTVQAPADEAPAVEELAVEELAVEELAVEELAVEELVAEEPATAAAEEPIQTEERVLEAAAPFVTETMADLYLEQGYPHEALELLLQLAEQRPDDEPLRAKIEQIESVIDARRDAALAVARAERVELAGAAAATGTTEATEAAEAAQFEEPADAPFDVAVAAIDASAFVAEPMREEPASMRDMFARMDRARPRAPSTITPKPLSRLRSDFAPMPDARDAGSESSADPFGFPNEEPSGGQHPAVPRSSGPQPTFNPSTAEIEDFDAWLRGLRGP